MMLGNIFYVMKNIFGGSDGGKEGEGSLITFV